MDQLRIIFTTFGIPEEMATDGGQEFTATVTKQFLAEWGVAHRQSSVAFLHSNCRAEIGVKSMKRLITGNVGNTGDLNSDSFQRAVLAYRNTPYPTTKLSPALIIFGHQTCTRELIPVLEYRYRPHHTWQDNTNKREEALRHRHALAMEAWTEHTKQLPPLRIGDHVMIQNQSGNFPTKWDKSGTIIEVKQHHQYLVKVDGAGRYTLRNRQFRSPSPRPPLQSTASHSLAPCRLPPNRTGRYTHPRRYPRAPGTRPTITTTTFTTTTPNPTTGLASPRHTCYRPRADRCHTTIPTHPEGIDSAASDGTTVIGSRDQGSCLARSRPILGSSIKTSPTSLNFGRDTPR